MNQKYQSIFEPLTFRSGVELKNRVVVAPMTNFSSHEDGTVSDAELAYYRERSRGVGAVITACTYVTRNGKGFPGEFGGDTDEMIPSLTRLAETIKGEGAKAILQIFHGGRECPPGLLPDHQPISAGNIASERPDSIPPREMKEGEIEAMVQAFGETTRRAILAGFDGVEIHGANMYLIQQFFSPHANRRTDKWGGSLEKRTAFPLAIIDTIKEVVRQHAKQPFLIGYRLSPEEREQPGISMEDTLVLADALAAKELDYIHVSVKDFWGGSIRNTEDKRSRIVLIQERIGNHVPVIGVGSLHTPDDVMKALEIVPVVALGRELIMEPEWIQKVQEGKESDIRTVLSTRDQQKLVIPDPLWGAIVHTPGWFPLVKE